MPFLSDKYRLFPELVKLLSTLCEPGHDSVEQSVSTIYVQPLVIWPVKLLHLSTDRDGTTRIALFGYGRHLIIAFYCSIPVISTKKSKFVDGGQRLRAGIASDVLHAWRRVQHDLDAVIQTHLNEYHGQVLVTGHSTGGALAVVQAAHLSQVIAPNRISCVTFGAPKFSGRRFVEKFGEIGIELYRVYNENDPVTSFPSLFPQLYHPDGIEIVLPGEEPWWRSWFSNDSIRYHTIDAYRDRISRCIG